VTVMVRLHPNTDDSLCHLKEMSSHIADWTGMILIKFMTCQEHCMHAYSQPQCPMNQVLNENWAKYLTMGLQYKYSTNVKCTNRFETLAPCLWCTCDRTNIHWAPVLTYYCTWCPHSYM
jgi:hypothetical protein